MNIMKRRINSCNYLIFYGNIKLTKIKKGMNKYGKFNLSG